MRVATYNIHSWKGADGRIVPQRIVRAIAEMDADIVALQEVVSPRLAGAACSLQELAEELGYYAIFGQTLLRQDARYGNALLSRYAPVRVLRHDISYSRDVSDDATGRIAGEGGPDETLPDSKAPEPRGILEAIFDVSGTTVRVLATHLGLTRRERSWQLQKLAELVDGDDSDRLILLGDLNDWFPWSRVRKALNTRFGPQPLRRSFPARFPLFPLDRIYVRPAESVRAVTALRHNPVRMASDHLPVLADVFV